MVSKSNITGLILAGGAGRRMNGQDKGLVTWQGKPLIAHVHQCLNPQVAELLISCNRNHARYQAYADRTIADTRRNFQGPLAGLEAASAHVQTEFLVVVSCDMPGLPADLVDRLTAPLWSKQESSPEISYAHDGIRAQYLCAAIRGKCLNSLTPYLDAGHRTVRDWFASRRSIRVDFADTPSSFTNFNTLA